MQLPRGCTAANSGDGLTRSILRGGQEPHIIAVYGEVAAIGPRHYMHSCRSAKQKLYMLQTGREVDMMKKRGWWARLEEKMRRVASELQELVAWL